MGPADSRSDSAGWHVGSVADAWPEAVPLAAAAASVQSATLTLLWALNSPHRAATAGTELPPSPEKSSTC